MLWLFGKCDNLCLIFTLQACVCVCVSPCCTCSNVYGFSTYLLCSISKPACRRLLFSVCVHVFSCVCVCEREKKSERGVRVKSLSQCMTLSNWLGITLMTTKTFSALKPIYTPIQAALMSALKSTTNSPWRKSLAHRGCSGCLILCVCVYACARVGACVRASGYVWECECACTCVCVCVCVWAHHLRLGWWWQTIL